MNNNKSGSKGFSGLSAMVSDVDAALEEVEAVQTQQTKEALRPRRANASTAQTRPEEEAVEEAMTPATPAPPLNKGNSATNWLLGGLVIVLITVFYMSSQKGPQTTPTVASSAAVDTSSAYTPSTYTPPTYTPPTYTPPVYAPPAPVVPEVAVRPSEVMPPSGRGLTLSLPQIRYCVAESMRLEAGMGITDRTSDRAIAVYNTAVEDYNSRCASFRYQGNDVETAKAEVERFRGEIVVEAMARFRSIPEPAPAANPGLYSQPVDRSPYGAAARSRPLSTTRIENPEEEEEE